MQCEWLPIFAENKRAKHARRARLRRKATQGELILLNGTLRAALQNLSVCGRGEGGERGKGGLEGGREREREKDHMTLSSLKATSATQITTSSCSPFPFANFQFLKKLWCCVGGGVKHENLVLSNELIKVELPSSDRRRASFDEWLMLETQAFQIFHGGISTRLMKPNFSSYPLSVKPRNTF